MSHDLFDQLAERDVPPPPPPPEFNRELHERVNRSLLASQLIDLALGALPWAIFQMLRPLGGWMRLTTTGKFSDSKKKHRPRP